VLAGGSRKSTVAHLSDDHLLSTPNFHHLRGRYLLVSDRLSPGAKLTYAMLLKYAWQNDYCFPGQERLAKDMGVTDRSVRTYLQELEREQFITIKQRGLGKPNLYELNLSASAADRKKFPVRTGKKQAS
jgi:hypothetical protein